MIKKIFTLLSFSWIGLSGLSASSQINIQGTMFDIDTLANMKVGPGSIYTALDLKSSNKVLKVFFLAVEKDNPYIRFNSLVGRDSVVMGERISSSATRHSIQGEIYFAGTNGDFYETTGSYVGRTINGSLINGEVVRTPHSSRPMIVSDRTNQMFIDQMAFSGNVKFLSDDFTIANVNDVRGNNELILYNTYNGFYTHTNPYGTEVLAELLPSEVWGVNKKLKAKVIQVVSDKGNMHMEKNQIVLSGHGTASDFLKKLQPDAEFELELNYRLRNDSFVPDIYGGVGGDRFILKNGMVTDNDWAENHPRTALGYNDQNVIFCVVDGRSASSEGVTTKQLGDIIKSAGASEAINLDGGGSSGMYIRHYGMMNHGSDGSERAVANGIFAVCLAPEDNQIAEILPKQRVYTLPPFGVITPTILGYNQYGLLINPDVEATFSCNPDVGYINEEGAFVASGSKDGVVTVALGNIKTTIQIRKIESAPIELRLDTVLVDNYKPYELEVRGLIGENPIEIYPSALNWSVEYPEICTIENGVLRGITNGETHVYGQLGDNYDTLFVKVQIPEKRKLPALSFSDEWDITASSALKEFKTYIDENDALCMEYKFSAGRLSNITLRNTASIFGLPDTIKLILDPVNAAFSKIILSMKANNEKVATAVYIDNPSAIGRSEINIPVAEMTSDPYDRNMYPLKLDYIQLYLAATGNVTGQLYAPKIKEFSAIYKNVALGLTPAWLKSGIKAYPNPIINRQLTLDLPESYGDNCLINILDAEGRLCLTQQVGSGINLIELSCLPAGLYILHVTNGKSNESIKVVLK